MNIYDIAKKAGVSVATVSRVINHNKNVSEKSRCKVLHVMQEEGYTPNVFARGLNLNSIKTVGILCPAIADINRAKQVAVIERLLREKGFDCLLCCTGGNAENKEEYFDVLLHKRVDAIIVLGALKDEEEEKKHFEAAAAKVPIVVINGLVRLENVYCVLCDELTAVEEAVCAMNRQGVREIVYLYDSDTYSGAQKLAGYRSGLAMCQIPFDENRVIKTDEHEDGIDSANEAVKMLLKSKIAISGLIAADDMLAVGALIALREKGIHVPIIGFNNSPYGRCTVPTLTSLDNRMETLCTMAVQILMEVFEKKDPAAKIVISAKWMQRETFQFC